MSQDGAGNEDPDHINPDYIDLEALGLAHLAKGARTATFAPNWKSVIAADATVGLATAAAGGLMLLWINWLGWIVIALGLVYVSLVARRFLQWRWLRSQAGLPTGRSQS